MTSDEFFQNSFFESKIAISTLQFAVYLLGLRLQFLHSVVAHFFYAGMMSWKFVQVETFSLFSLANLRFLFTFASKNNIQRYEESTYNNVWMSLCHHFGILNVTFWRSLGSWGCYYGFCISCHFLYFPYSRYILYYLYNRFDYSFQKGSTHSVNNHTRHCYCSIMFLDALISKKRFYINLGNIKLCFSQNNKNHTLRHNKPPKVLG